MLPGDLEAVAALFRAELGREPDLERLTGWTSAHPAAVLEELAPSGRVLVGFAYSCGFAPDVLELANIVVSARLRGCGAGSRLLEHLAHLARVSYAAIILVNSDLYASAGKRDASSFYERAGYERVATTPSTQVFFKQL
jgi:GNAT superfamily N-acetyltransferase